ncbi:MAG: prolyl oligopeptidase family serine peptidase [Bacteroidetes bacterium]|nr:prolyl oligopeptidase family serine peptidase [Bacteroidota bacterium]MBU1484587.1 prolyl oligopeptidase family serine peptidase [Bacteroidota bacterium]MBU2267676.1 prolyl oligopeptidase family serine peptidase [Bacteroidota bacterium]MBU2375981.1 prolyl oligopeptidase family serine peptidase [Bacteroidota bacterium]
MSFYSFFKKCKVIAFILTVFSYSLVEAQEISGYQKPPEAITQMIENTINRSVIFSSHAQYMAILEEPGYPSIEEVSKPYIKLAGLRVNGLNFSNSRTSYFATLSLKNLRKNEEFNLAGIPKDAKIHDVIFSLDERYISFTITTQNEIQLWLGDLEQKLAKRLSDIALNDTYGRLYQWSPDSKSLLVKCVAPQKEIPKRSPIPEGPNTQENIGKSAPNRTYQDLLKTPTDETFFDYYLTTQLKMVFINGDTADFNRPEIYRDFDFSPDGSMVMTKTIHRPYSYIVPIGSFPYTVSILDKYGKLNEKVAESQLADHLPQGFDAVLEGSREFGWRADEPQTFYWVEAQDNGDPSNRIAIRDVIYTRKVGETINEKKKLADCYLRFEHIDWGNDQIAMVTERWWKTRGERRVFIKPNNPKYRVNIWDRYYEDTYSDPGEFVTVKNDYNKDILLLDYSAIRRITDPNNIWIFSISQGASPKGDRPFLLKFNVKTKLTDTLFHSRAPFYERPIYFDNKQDLIITRESVIEPTNYFVYNENLKRQEQLTFFKNPYPQLFGISKQQIQYQRKDHLNLTANLYLPKDYNPTKGTLPVLMWAYPKEFKTISAAGAVKGSPYQFVNVSWASPIFWVTQGYAVLDNVDMPIVGESNDQPNDTFVKQLTQNAEAAINKITKMGIADPKKIAIGGHSYGAFMTANLLAQTKLFAAGIARSGAYNRTLTPFGFQAEERTYWDNPKLYFDMSPFSYANKITTPLLLIHGEADDNSGTFPIQSERFYSALKGFGATTRLVYLPAEAHSYRAKESILHMLWEMNNWLDKYVKNKDDKPIQN